MIKHFCYLLISLLNRWRILKYIKSSLERENSTLTFFPNFKQYRTNPLFPQPMLPIYFLGCSSQILTEGQRRQLLRLIGENTTVFILRSASPLEKGPLEQLSSGTRTGGCQYQGHQEQMLTSSHKELSFLLTLQWRGNRPEPLGEHWLGRTLNTNKKINENSRDKGWTPPLLLVLVAGCERKPFRPRTGRGRTNLLPNQHKLLPSNFLVSSHKSEGKVISSAVLIKNKGSCGSVLWIPMLYVYVHNNHLTLLCIPPSASEYSDSLLLMRFQPVECEGSGSFPADTSDARGRGPGQGLFCTSPKCNFSMSAPRTDSFPASPESSLPSSPNSPFFCFPLDFFLRF